MTGFYQQSLFYDFVCRHEEIISCISALDEVLAQFDDSSLPYINDLETCCGSSDPSNSNKTTVVPTLEEAGLGVSPSRNLRSHLHHQNNNHNNNPELVTNLVVVNDNTSIVSTDPGTSVPSPSSHLLSSASSCLVVNGQGAGAASTAAAPPPSNNSPGNSNSKLVDQNQNLDWNSTSPQQQQHQQQRNGRERNKNNNQNSNNGHHNSPLIHTSHLIQIPVVEPTTQGSSAASSASNNSSAKQHQQHQQQSSQRGFGGSSSSPHKYQNNSGSNNNSGKRSTFHHSSSSQTSAQSSPSGTKAAATVLSSGGGGAEMNGNNNGHHNKVTGSGSHNNSQHQYQNNNGIGSSNGSGGKKGGKGTSGASVSPPSGGGTYSKGTSYEILIPKINSGSFSRDSSVSSGKGTITTSSHSSRASIMVPVIESAEVTPAAAVVQGGIVAGNVAKIRSQLNMGIFQPGGTSPPQQQLQSAVTQVPGDGRFPGCCEVGSASASPQKLQHSTNNGKLMKGNNNINNNVNNGNGVSSTYITTSGEGKGSLGQSSSSGVSSAVAAMIMMSSSCSSSTGGMKGQQSDDEQWNFPSEKNLPRSLRKTRKTCFLDEGDGSGRQGMGSRAESPFCCSESSNNGGMSSSTMDHSDHLHGIGGSSYAGSNGSKSPRMMPRGKGGVIPAAKCEIINKGDGNFALAECTGGSTPKQMWNGQGVAGNVVSVGSGREGGRAQNNRKKIYEDVILASQQQNLELNPGKRQVAAALPISIIAAQNCGGSGGGASTSSPSSTFTSSSGVSLSVTSGPNTFVGEEDSIFVGRRGAAAGNGHYQQQQQSSKARVRQQVPSPGGTDIPSPKTHLSQNQFVPLVYPSQVTMSSHHSPMNSVEIGTEEEQHRDDRELDYEDDDEEYIVGGDPEDDDDDELGQVSSANNSPLKTVHPDHLMRNKSSDTDFEETASDSKILEKARRNAHGGKRGHSKRSHHAKHFDGVGPNGSLPNQSQMMRMMMMMKSNNGKNNSVDSGSSSSRSSSSSGSVSVKSSSSSDNNCGDVFHENIVQDYPTNIFNVGAEANGSNTELVGDGISGQEVEEGNRMNCDDNTGAAVDITSGTSGDRINRGSEKPGGGDTNEGVVGGTGAGRRTITTNGAVVVLRGKCTGRGNVQLSQLAAANAGKQKHGLVAAIVGGNQHNSSNQPNATLEIDDGYLSMINRNEVPLLWPEEFIENETFSKAEMKRLSVNMNDDTDVEEEDVSSNSNSPRRKSAQPDDVKIVTGVEKAHRNEPKRKAGRRGNAAAGRSSTEKTDYFSDDSLELEGEEDLLLQATSTGAKMLSNNNGDQVTVVRAATSFVIPFHTNGNEFQEAVSKKESKSNPIRKQNSQVSRIPKPASGNSNRRNSSGNTGRQHSPGSTSPVRKPCSFFIPFSDTHGGSDVKLSSEDNTASLAPPIHAPSTRSTSLPSSRRNSSPNTGASTEQSKQPLAWNISACDEPPKQTRQQPRQPADKASNVVLDTTYVVTDTSTISNQSSQQQLAPTHQGAPTSSSVTINNNKANNHLIATTSGVTVTTTATASTTGAQQNDPSEKVVIVDGSHNEPIAAATATTTTTITCTSNANEIAEGGGAGGGASMTKPHKFQKQQTFIVSPFSSNDRNTCATSSGGLGQRLIDPDEDPDNPTTIASSPSFATQVTNEMTTPTKFDSTTTTRNPAVTTTTLNGDDDETKSRMTSSMEETQAEVLNVWEKLSESTGGGTFKKCGSELKIRPTTSSVFLSSGESSGNTPKEQVSLEAGGNKGKVSEESKEYNENKLEGHNSVSAELESVVKMFLKATEGLLDPDEEEEAGKIGSDQLKSSAVPLVGATSKDTSKENVDIDDQRKQLAETMEQSVVVTGQESDSQLEDLSCSFDEMVRKITSKLNFVKDKTIKWFCVLLKA